MLQPKKSKYRKAFRGKNRGVASRGNTVAYGEYVLVALEHGLYTSRQIESARKVIASTSKRLGRTWIRVFPDLPITKKPVGVKMGSGKGDIETYVARIQPGRILFEVADLPEDIARSALRKAGHKTPMKTKVLSKAELEGQSA